MKGMFFGMVNCKFVRPTNLQRKLRVLGKVLVLVAVVLCGVIVGMGFIREYFSGEITKDFSLELIKVFVAVLLLLTLVDWCQSWC